MSTIVTDATMGQNSAFVDASLVAVCFVTDDGVDIVLTTGTRLSVPCTLEQGQRFVDMVADVRGALQVDRDALSLKGETKIVSRRSLFLHKLPQIPEEDKNLQQNSLEYDVVYSQIRTLVEAGNPIEALKRHKEFTNASLITSKHWVERYKRWLHSHPVGATPPSLYEF